LLWDFLPLESIQVELQVKSDIVEGRDVETSLVVLWQDMQVYLNEVFSHKLELWVHDLSYFFFDRVTFWHGTQLPDLRLELVLGNEWHIVFTEGGEWLDVVFTLEDWHGFEKPHRDDEHACRDHVSSQSQVLDLAQE